MADTYTYRPRLGYDMRIKPTKKNTKVQVQGPCAWPDCQQKGSYRAPRRKNSNSDDWLCLDHVREVNKSWNFFSEMNAEQVRQYMEGNITGHRPTWSTAANSRAAQGSDRTKPNPDPRRFAATGDAADPFNLFPGDPSPQSPEAPRRIPLTRPQREALETLDLEDTASKDDVKKRYKALVKRYHPDANGGDTGAVERLRRVIKAYQTLKSSRFAMRDLG